MTTIPWTDHTWNPIGAFLNATNKRGWFCTKVALECANCYAETMNVNNGANRGRMGNGVRYAVDQQSKVRLELLPKTLDEPRHARKPRMIFVCSMTDLYGEFVPDEWITAIYDVMDATPWHTYQILTKRASRRHLFLSKRYCDRAPAQNVWELASCGTQQTLDTYLPFLLATPAMVRGLSVEPMLQALNLRRTVGDGLCGLQHMHTPELGCWNKIDWVICGGESGPDARLFNLEWADSLLEQCNASGIPFFMKQLGSAPHSDKHFISHRGGTRFCGQGFWRYLNDRKGEDPEEWPEHLRVRAWPVVGKESVRVD